jgi:hypothetical protein
MEDGEQQQDFELAKSGRGGHRAYKVSKFGGRVNSGYQEDQQVFRWLR